MKIEKPCLQIILIIIVLDLPVGIDSMPYPRTSKLKLKESRQRSFGMNNGVIRLLAPNPDVFGPKQVNTLILLWYYHEVLNFAQSIYWKSKSRLDQSNDRNVNGKRIGTNTIYEVKLTGHLMQFHKFLVWFFVKDMIMGNNPTDYTSMNEKYFYIMIVCNKVVV